jgi:alpha-1,2-mannosyltransferase
MHDTATAGIGSLGHAGTAPARRRSRLTDPSLALVAGVAMLAFGARLLIVLRGGGLHGLHGYDDGVYYSGAASLVFGRLPYRDFLFLHPPGVLLALAPFAELGRITSDPTGFAVARVAFMAVGALNAALVTRLAARAGKVAAVVAGLLYALWLPSMLAERTTLLEPLVTTALLGGLLLLSSLRGEPSTRRALLAGAVLGAGACVKLWGAVPLAVVVLFLLARRARPTALRVVVGATAAGLLICGPFLASAGAAMVRMVVVIQVGRERSRGSVLLRLSDVTGALRHLPGAPFTVVVLVTLLACCVVLAATLVALRDPRTRLWAALLVAHVTVLLVTPAYFAHYASFAGVPIALVLGAAAAALVRRRSAPARRSLPLAAVLTAVVLLGAHSATAWFGVPYPARQLAAGVPAAGCVVADDNTALIELDVLSRDLRAGCRLQPDVTGVVYDLISRRPGQRGVPQEENPEWQATILAYLTSGSATAMVGGTGNGFADETALTLYTLPIRASSGRFVVLGR